MFQDQHIVITGGSSGLGLELAHQLANEGAKLTLIARNQSKLENAKATLITQHPNLSILIRSVDVCNETDITHAINAIAESQQGIDILINSAGILREGYFEQLPMQDFRDVMEINFFGTINAIRATLPYLKKSQGKIVNIASMAGLTGVFGYTPYCSSKHALVGLSESLRYELKPSGVTVQLVCPGEFDSPLVDELDRYRTDENRAHTLTIPKASVEKIASDTIAEIQGKRFMITPGFMTRAAAFSVRHFTGVSRWMGDRIITKAQKNK
ncbi:MAG: SDR family oxidoreductase [Pseudomonadales bacterium]|nr:SDR family oxidoreductase [Pseudomonadales bacterium]